MEDGSVTQELEHKAKELYELCDVENKGWITKEDLCRLSQYTPLNIPQLEEVFESLEKKNEEFLTLNEFIECLCRFTEETESDRSDEEESQMHHDIFESHKQTYSKDDKEEANDCFHTAMEQYNVESGLSNDDNIRQLWTSMQRDNPKLLPALEQIIAQVSNDIKNSRTNYQLLQQKLHYTLQEHKEDLQRMENEMEEQIREEKEHVLREERIKRQKIRESIEEEITKKEDAYKAALLRKEAIQQRLNEMKSDVNYFQEENKRLLLEKEELKNLLHQTQSALSDNQAYIEEMHRRLTDDRRERARTVFEINDVVAKEREIFIQQLEFLRDTNRQLKEQQDESAIATKCSENPPKDSILAEILDTTSSATDDECQQDDCASKTRTATFTLQVPIQTPERLFKVVFVGDSGVGKSCIIRRLCHNEFNSNFTATIGIDFQVKSMLIALVDKPHPPQAVALQLWDTAGQERFRSITTQYFRKCDAIVVVYDVSREQSFLNARQWMSEIDEMAGVDEKPTKLLLANKQDLPNVQINSVQGETLAQSHEAIFRMVSAKSGNGVEDAFIQLASNLTERQDLEIIRASDIVSRNSLMYRPVLLHQIKAESRKSCC